MAMIECQECRAKISSNAQACLKCGNPIARNGAEASNAASKSFGRLLKIVAIGVAAVLVIVAIGFANRTPEDTAKYAMEARVDAHCDQTIADSALGDERRMARQMCGLMKASVKAAPAETFASAMKDTSVGTAGPAYLPVESFTVNLQPETGEQFLQVGMTLQLANSDHKNLINTKMNIVRSRVLLLLSEKKASELLSADGKKKLSHDIAVALNLPFYDGGKPQNVTDVLFTSFVIQ